MGKQVGLGRTDLTVVGMQDPVRSCAAVTKSDDTTYDGGRGLYIGVTGDVVVILEGDSAAVTFKAVPAGTILPFEVNKVMAATTATDIVILY
jgi:hypothetical protein